MGAKVVVFWEWLMDLHLNGDIWSLDQFLGHHKHLIRTHQHFFLRNPINPSFFRGSSWDPTWKNLSESSPMITFSKSSHFASSTNVLVGDARVFDCYEFSPTRAEDSTLGWCEMAATRHSLAKDWQPRISRTRPSEGNFTFWCRVEATALRVWR